VNLVLKVLNKDLKICLKKWGFQLSKDAEIDVGFKNRTCFLKNKENTRFLVAFS
jgi:hypothetical protein